MKKKRSVFLFLFMQKVDGKQRDLYQSYVLRFYRTEKKDLGRSITQILLLDACRGHMKEAQTHWQER